MLRIAMIVVVAVVFSVGCSMQDTANEMKDTSKRIETNSKHLGDRTNDLEYNMGKLYSSQELGHQLDELFAENGHNNSAGVNDEAAMLVAGATAVHSMYFQTWKGDHGETLEEFDYRYAKSLEVLFGRLLDHIPSDYQIDVFRPSRSYLGVAAFAVQMDQMDFRLERLLKSRRLPHFSLYNVLSQTLKDSTLWAEILPQTTNLVLTRKREAQYLLQLRHNYFPMMVVSRMTDIKDRGDLRRLWMSWRGQKVDISLIDVAEYQEWLGWLENAERTRADLEAAGVRPQYNGIFADLVDGVDFGQKEFMAAAPNSDPLSRDEVLRRLGDVYDRVAAQSKGRVP